MEMTGWRLCQKRCDAQVVKLDSYKANTQVSPSHLKTWGFLFETEGWWPTVGNMTIRYHYQFTPQFNYLSNVSILGTLNNCTDRKRAELHQLLSYCLLMCEASVWSQPFTPQCYFIHLLPLLGILSKQILLSLSNCDTYHKGMSCTVRFILTV